MLNSVFPPPRQVLLRGEASTGPGREGVGAQGTRVGGKPAVFSRGGDAKAPSTVIQYHHKAEGKE